MRSVSVPASPCRVRCETSTNRIPSDVRTNPAGSDGLVMRYHPRIVEKELAVRLASAGAVLIEGPRTCGKTVTGQHHAASEVLLDVDAGLRRAAELEPGLVLEGPAPRLIDEWQTVPSIWNHVRRAVDMGGGAGRFILTGSAVPRDDTTRHRRARRGRGEEPAQAAGSGGSGPNRPAGRARGDRRGRPRLHAARRRGARAAHRARPLNVSLRGRAVEAVRYIQIAMATLPFWWLGGSRFGASEGQFVVRLSGGIQQCSEIWRWLFDSCGFVKQQVWGILSMDLLSKGI